ncbi:MAG: NAD(P)-dependent oxidoreductase [Parvularculaceae bacterium]|nr:NAD(P)-dependent oxidoreductase [Parvularculaceae bacterium]
MLNFTNVGRETPPKRSARERRDDYQEIYRAFNPTSAASQASRCSQCGVPFCQHHCPLTNDIPDWLRLAAEGRLKDAYALSAATNPMPEICGRICPQDRLCEGACVIEQSRHGAVTIGAVEQFLSETAWANGWVEPIETGSPTGRSVGIIGAGPAGLAAAEDLRRAGVRVVIYDRHDRAGGLLVYGIPNFKLDKDVVARRIDRLAAAGVEFRLNFAVGGDASLDQLRVRHDAVLIATGVYKGRNLDIGGEDADGVVAALDYLTASNRKGLGDDVAAFDDGRLNAAGKRVVVIGGGDTAMDCVRTAVRQGAASVTCLYRRDRANMPGSQRETANAEEEGVAFEWLAAPKSIVTIDRRAVAIAAVRMRAGQRDASGRRSVEEVPGADFRLDADLFVKALGFEPEDVPALFGAPALKLTTRGTIETARGSLETRIPGVYAAGDIVRGASLVVWAIADGRKAAAEISARLATPAPTLLAAE